MTVKRRAQNLRQPVRQFRAADTADQRDNLV